MTLFLLLVICKYPQRYPSHMPPNYHRQKPIKDFMDRNHPVVRAYYDLMDNPPSAGEFKKALRRLIEKDPFFFDPYLVLAEMLVEESKEQDAYELIRDAYNRVLEIITDESGNWPERIEWGWLENRHILRAISHYAYLLWEEGKTTDALKLFRQLLKLNPNDNQGARCAILALRLGLGPEWQEEFRLTEGPTTYRALDALKVDDWFTRNAKKFPEEFDWLFKQWKESGLL